MAVDTIDGFCKSLSSAYKCLKRDYGEKCDYARQYNWEVNDKGVVKCSEFNLKFIYLKSTSLRYGLFGS